MVVQACERARGAIGRCNERRGLGMDEGGGQQAAAVAVVAVVVVDGARGVHNGRRLSRQHKASAERR